MGEDEDSRDPSRFFCPYPGCKRSFAELWRLKVHYRAPPDIRGSGKERGACAAAIRCAGELLGGVVPRLTARERASHRGLQGRGHTMRRFAAPHTRVANTHCPPLLHYPQATAPSWPSAPNATSRSSRASTTSAARPARRRPRPTSALGRCVVLFEERCAHTQRPPAMALDARGAALGA
jgi:hypothetical protein